MLFIFDWDGTIAGTKNYLTEDVKIAVRKLKEMGHSVLIATGRHPLEIIPKIEDNDDLSDFIIGANGSIIFNRRTRKSIWSSKIPNDVKAKAIEICKTDKISLVSMDDTGVKIAWNLISNFTSKYKGYWKKEDAHNYKEIDEEGIMNADVVLFIIPVGRVPNFQDICDSYVKQFEDKVFVSSGDSSNIAVVNKNIDKWTAIQKFVKMMGIEDKIITFGDSFNDIEMLKNADIGVAMGNAVDIAKKSADYVIGNADNKGILDFVTKIENSQNFLHKITVNK